MQSLPSDELTDLLVAYALDALEPTELDQVHRLLIEQPELRQTVAELRTTVGVLPYGLPESTPPADLRQRTLDVAVGRVAPRSAVPLPVSQAESRPSRMRLWLGSLVGLVAIVALGFFFTSGELRNVRSELIDTQNTLATTQASSQQVAGILADTEQVAELAGDNGRATVLVNPEGQLLLAAQLPPLNADQVYQLWLISGENAPVSAGVFQVDASGQGILVIETNQSVAGATLAVTAEPGPNGSPGPTSDVLIAGQVS